MIPSMVEQRLGESIGALVAANRVTRTERECETCDGKGWQPINFVRCGTEGPVLRGQMDCPRCKDGIRTVYRMAS